MNELEQARLKRRQKELETKPQRDADITLEAWLDANGQVDWTCLSADVPMERRVSVIYDMVFTQLQSVREPGDEHILYQTYLTSIGGVERLMDNRMVTDTGREHAWWIVKAGWRDFRFVLKMAWKAWRDPIKSSHASAAVQTQPPQHDPD